MKFSRRFAVAGTAAFLLSVAGAASAEVLVVRALGPSARAYPAGRSLADTASLSLRAGDSVTVLSSRGTRTFRGPGNFRVTGAVQAQAGGVAGAIGNPRARARIGAVRGAGPAVAAASRPVDPWQIVATSSGPACVADPANVVLWRPDASDTIRVNVTRSDGAPTAVEWPAGASTLRWPSGPVQAGSEYRILRRGVNEPARLRIVVVSGAPADRQQIAATLISNGCTAQLDRLIESTRVD